ncbi:MAG: ABC transporter substrate-binding protein [bacterium]|nr:ABC transporter substrate-binding protein [bacterium]
MKFRKIISCICLLVLILCGCQTAQTSDSKSQLVKTDNDEGSQFFTMMYCSTDSFNPYKSKSRVNQLINLLLYDPLVKLDSTFSPVNIIANSVKVEGKTCIVKIKDIKFSDGSAVKAEDVVFSLKVAKASQTKYAQQLAQVVSVSAQDDVTVCITLAKNDPYFANLLDFPIIKTNSDTATDKDNKELPAVGCGRYTVDLTEKTLKANESYHLGAPKIKSISLLNAPDREAVEGYLGTGNISIYYSDLSDGILPSMNGVANIVELNNLVYLGVNTEDVLLKNSNLRYAVSSALNRSDICSTAYYSYATPAKGPYNPVWEDSKGVQTIEEVGNINIAIANLKEIGYNNKDSQGFYVNDSGHRIVLSLLCNSDNTVRLNAAKLIKEQLAAAGIELKIDAVDWNTYTARLAAKQFQLYLAETKILTNADITELVTFGGSVAYGISDPEKSQKADSSADSESKTAQGNTGSMIAVESADEHNREKGENNNLSCAQAVSGFYNGTLSLADVITAFIGEMSVIPVCYRCGIEIHTSRLSEGLQCSVSDPLFGFENCTLN